MVQAAAKKLNGIFLNPTKANCSIYESGRMMYESLLRSDAYELYYLEIDNNNRNISNKYDFYVFNYHHATMGWLDTKCVSQLPGLKVAFVLETLPNNPFILCPPDDFNAYCVLDPSMNITDKKVYAFPRPLEVASELYPYHEPAVPVIGTFGFATPGKGFELVVDAVNREFDRAVVKINIPSGTYTGDGCWKLHKQYYADYLSNLCKKIAKEGVDVIVTNDFMTKADLIKWCGQNTLNCFLYNRDQPGLSATTDQAISSGRPLAVSDNETFRHLHSYIKAYPFRSLRESIALSQPEVLKMQKEWTPEKFSAIFEKVLDDFNLFEKNQNASIPIKQIKLKKKIRLYPLISNCWSFLIDRVAPKIPEKIRKPLRTILIKMPMFAAYRLKKIIRTIEILLKIEYKPSISQRQINMRASDNGKETILIVTHKGKQCGIYQYGSNIAEALQKSTRYNFSYVECSDEKELHDAVDEVKPAVIIYNYYPITMPWLTPRITRLHTIPQLGIMHEVTQEDADKATTEMFDFHLCPDPTLIENNPITFKTNRLISPYINTKNIPDIVTIGSFGFGFGDKGFERLIESVQKEFDYAKIVLHIPFNDLVDKGNNQPALATAKRCRSLVTKPGIELIINHAFVSKHELLDFLAGNTLNAFFYDTEKHKGISSTIEHALAVQRPLAITNSGMFRHVTSATPSICIEVSSLKEIINNDIVPLVPFYNEWSEAQFIMDYERILDKVLSFS